MYDPRREERRKAARVELPDDVEPRMLDPEARTELRSLVRETADLVARHLVVTGQLLDEEPDQALAHARAARALAGRVSVVREAAGLAAYAVGEWTEALSDLRAARRISGRPEHLAVMADCERALERPERALAYADDPDVPRLAQADRVELTIVLSGARRDMGQHDAAVLLLQEPARRTKAHRPWAARLWYAYADALLEAGRETDARQWFSAAAEVDQDGETDAVDRLLELDGVVLDDVEHDDSGPPDEDASESPVAPSRSAAATMPASSTPEAADARTVEQGTAPAAVDDRPAPQPPAPDRAGDDGGADGRPRADAAAPDEGRPAPGPAAVTPLAPFADPTPAAAAPVEPQEDPPVSDGAVPGVTFLPAADDDDGTLRLFD